MRPIRTTIFLLAALLFVFSAANSLAGKIFVVASLPRQSDTALYEALVKEADKIDAMKNHQMQYICTLDEEACVRLKVDLASGAAMGCLYLDLSGAVEYAPIAGGRAAVIVPTKANLLESKLENVKVIETLPSGREVAEAALNFDPVPKGFALIHTEGSAGAEQFVRDVQETFQGNGRQADPRLCILPAGACRNEQDVAQALEASLKDMGSNASIIVWPDTNTLKFAYAIMKFAEKHKMKIVAVGNFPGEQAVLLIKRPEGDIVRQCLDAIVQMLAQSATSSPAQQPILKSDESELKNENDRQATVGRQNPYCAGD